ncbi:MAG TPA: DUF4352 domain-containing protein [Herpetosiphonaceae bacterium]|nr:DUF4352 domain-containing protein [Herpetosiphonaceae bacterium]
MSTSSPHVEQLVQQGIVAAREGRYGAAQQALRQAVSLSPNHEQAWLWLSGVEDNEQAKLAALHEVLRINPQSQAAQRGIDHLSQPKQVDLSSLLPAKAPPPPPARAGWSPPPAKAAPPPAAPASAAPSLQSGGWAAPVPSPQPAPSPPAAPAEPPAAEQQVASDMVADLRPAISKAAKRRRFMPSVSEIGIMVALAGLLFGFFYGARFYLRGRVPENVSLNLDVRPTSVLLGAGQPQPAQVPAQTNSGQPAVGQPAAPPSTDGSAGYTSRSYTMRLMGGSINEANSVAIINIELANPGARPIGFRSRDFQLFNGLNSRLTLDTAASTVFGGRSDAELQIDAGQTVAGTIVFNGDASRTPITLVWQPFNGGVTQNIVVR